MIRVLITTQPAVGHFHPLVPLARALGAAGHDVAVACAPSFRQTVEASGLRCVPAGLDWLESEAEAAFPQLREHPPGGPTTIWPSIFADVTARRMIPDLLALAREWPPDVVVRDPLEFGGCIAAERLGIPHATAGAGLFARPERWGQVVGPQVAELRRQHGLPPDPDLAALFRYLDLAFVPPGFLVAPSDYVSPVTHFLRPVIFDRSGAETLPAWAERLPDRPTVFATLGPVFNRTPGIFDAILVGLQMGPVNLIAAVGRNQDPARFGAQPPHVHVERYIPQTLLFPRCDAIITHGGFNTVLAALGHGLPMVIIPIVADQLDNARRCALLRVAQVIPRADLTHQAVRMATREVLGNPLYRQNAARLRAEMESLPSAEHGAELLERLASERAPLLARR